MKLIDNAKDWWRLWSLRLGALGTAITTVLIASPEAALFAWGLMPTDLKQAMPPELTPLIGVFVFVVSMGARLVKQRKLHDETERD